MSLQAFELIHICASLPVWKVALKDPHLDRITYREAHEDLQEKIQKQCKAIKFNFILCPCRQYQSITVFLLHASSIQTRKQTNEAGSRIDYF